MTKSYNLTEISRKILASKDTYIICADIDHLMEINRKMRTPAGDAAIAEAAARIGRSVQDGMDYFRIGANRFVILTGSTDPAVAEEIAKKIISYAKNNVVWGGDAFRFTISMGIVKIPLHISDAKEIIKKSEDAMIKAKSEGRNTYRVM